MTRFAHLFAAIDATTSTLDKVEAMRRYFAAAPAADAAWAVFFLTGRRLTRLLTGRSLGDWAIAATGLEPWLLGECYGVVGDGAETAALILDAVPGVPSARLGLADWIETRVQPLRQRPAEAQRAEVLGWVAGLERWERFTLLKLLTGELRVGVSQTLVVRALAAHADLPVTTIAARLAGAWSPSPSWFAALVSPEAGDTDRRRPFPFALASPLDASVAEPAGLAGLLGPPSDWQVEWKWDGIRAQIVRRDGDVAIWSRGDELLTDRFPEVAGAAQALADGTVLDGELLAWEGDGPRPFSALQRRIGRERQLARAMREVPVAFVAYDVLESAGRDCRGDALADRRSTLESIIAALPASTAVPASPHDGLPFDGPGSPAESSGRLRLSPRLATGASRWDDVAAIRADARSRAVEGLMLKRRTASYTAGRHRGDWWKWKVEPYTIDAVLIYAQPGSGKRASLLTDYTFGLWHEGALVPVAKAYSGLTNDEIAAMDRWIRRHTVERFGPVRHVEPFHVIELGFEAIARSTRHRSGVAVRFPRMLRLRTDKRPADADTLAALVALIPDAS